MASRRGLLLLGWALLVGALGFALLLPQLVGADHEPGHYDSQDWPTCSGGVLRGASPDCPLWSGAGGPTPTPNIYAVPVFTEDGSTRYLYSRGFSLADIYISGILTVGVALGALAWLVSQLRRG